MSILISIILANVLLSVVSAVGIILILKIPHSKLHAAILPMVALSAGTLLGGSFLHLLPEAVEQLPSQNPFLITLLSFLGFFVLEKIIHYRHCHDDDCGRHSMGYINLVGDALHNWIDGILIASAFSTSFSLGVVTTFAVMVHEIPQEIGDLGVLLHAGFDKKRAVIANVMISLASLLGGVFGFLFLAQAEISASLLLPVAAGSFLYLASSDLLPEIQKENHRGRFLIAMVGVSIGVLLMAALTLLE